MGEVSQRRIGYSPGILMGDANAAPPNGTPGGSTADTQSKRFVDDILERFRNSARTTDTWRTQAIEDYQFVSGDQWSTRDLAELDDEAKGVHRPHLVINKVLGPVLFLAGVHRQSRVEPTILPPFGGSPAGAELMRALLKRVSQLSREPKIDSTIFFDKEITGLSYWKIVLDYENDPDGMPQWLRIHPLSIFPDPNWFDAGWENAEYVLHATWQTKEQAQDAHPEFAEEIARQYGEWLNETSSRFGADAGTAEGAGDSWSGERLFWDPQTQRIRVLEYWYKRKINVPLVQNNINGEVSGDPEKVRAMRQRLQQMPHAANDFSFMSRPHTSIRKAEVLNSLLLADDPSPFDAPMFPIFPSRGYYFWQNPFGIVRPMKDPQREKNRRRSSIIELVQSMPIGGFFNKKTGGAKSEDIKRFSDGSTSEIPYEDTLPVAIRPPELPQTLVYLDTASDREISDVVSMTGLSPSRPGYTTSAKHAESLQRPSMITQDEMIRSFWEDKEIAVDFMIRAIQQYLPVGKALQMLQVIAQREQQTPASQVPPTGAPAPSAPPAAPGPVSSLLQTPGLDVMAMLQEAMQTRYEVTFDLSKPWEPSLQAAMYDTLRDLAKEFPGSIPPDVMVQAGQDNGIITEDQGKKILAHIQEQMAAQQAATAGRPPQ